MYSNVAGQFSFTKRYGQNPSTCTDLQDGEEDSVDFINVLEDDRVYR